MKSKNTETKDDKQQKNKKSILKKTWLGLTTSLVSTEAFAEGDNNTACCCSSCGSAGGGDNPTP